MAVTTGTRPEADTPNSNRRAMPEQVPLSQAEPEPDPSPAHQELTCLAGLPLAHSLQGKESRMGKQTK